MALINMIILLFATNFPFTVSITESITGNMLLGIVGLIIWYPIRYIPFRKDALFYSVATHVIAGSVVILAWLFTTVGILSAMFSSTPGYVDYLTDSIFWRGFVGVMAGLVMVLIYYLVSYARNLQERAQAEEKLRTLVKETELNMLKSQINPHFLFNSLNSISSLINSNPEKAREMIIRLSDFLRYSLKHRENEYVSLEEEIVRLKDYLSIEQIRFGEKLQYRMQTTAACKEVLVPTMILQPLVENAIKHGVYESLEPVTIELYCKLSEGFLQIELKNEFDPEQPSQRGTGVGHQNVAERIRLAYDGKGKMIHSVNDGIFTVTLYIPHEKINV